MKRILYQESLAGGESVEIPLYKTYVGGTKVRLYVKKCEICQKEFTGDKTVRFCSRTCSSNRPLKHIDVNGKLKCTKCNEDKDVSEFGKSKRVRCGYNNTCKVCFQKWENEYLRSLGENLERCIVRQLRATKRRTKTGSKFENYNIDREHILELYSKQKGLCALSGIKMTLFCGGRGHCNNNMSIDRIDNTSGYIKGNVHLTCAIVNLMRNKLSINELITYCKQIIKHNEEQEITN